MSGIIIQALLAGMGTCLGAAMAILPEKLTPRAFSLLLGLASGIMAAVVVLDLLPFAFRLGGTVQSLTGCGAGFLSIAVLDRAMNELSPINRPETRYLKIGYLIAAGISIHDFPEGLAIAAGFSAPGPLGPLMALAIGLHNIPEGMAVAAPLRAGGMSALKIMGLTALVSVVTPLGTAVGLVVLKIAPALLSAMMAFAAGAMIYITGGKLLPESLHHHRLPACLGMAAGILTACVLGLFFK